MKQTHHIIFEIFLAKAQSEGFGRMCLVYIKNQFKHAKVVLQFTVHLGKSNRNFLLYGRMQLVPTTNNYSLINSNGFPAFARLKTIHIAQTINNSPLRLSEKSAPPLRVKQTHHIIFEIFLAKAQSEGFGRMCLVYIKNQFKHAKVVLQFTVHLCKSNRNFLL